MNPTGESATDSQWLKLIVKEDSVKPLSFLSYFISGHCGPNEESLFKLELTRIKVVIDVERWSVEESRRNGSSPV